MPAPGSLKALLLPPSLNNVQARERKGCRRGTARNFLHSFPLSNTPVFQSLEGPTRKPRHASVFSTHSDTQAVPAFHGIWMFKAFIRHASAFKTHRHAVYHCIKEVQHRFWLPSRTRPVKNCGIFHDFWVFFRFVICRVVPRNATSWVQPLLLEGQRVHPCECFPHRPATNLPHVMVSACFNQSSTKNGVDAIL